jgi:branched-subunit amino acid aminotransferase/4-amino-4-deoxychorismate lyase
MIGSSILVNGRLASPSEALFGLDDIDATNGYGCYETLKVRAGVLYFASFHEERLLHSAGILGIVHGVQGGELAAALELLVRDNGIGECHVKVMMIGHEHRPADWYAFLLPPVVPPERSYTEGVQALLFRGERQFPNAKSLSMLLSTVAYRLAKGLACYDALLVNGRGQITEGTRTNLFYVRSGDPSVVYTPPLADVLDGITRRTLIEALAAVGVRTIERPLRFEEALDGGYGLMVTSTSSRVIPVSGLRGPVSKSTLGNEPSVKGTALSIPAEIANIRRVYDSYLEKYAGRLGGLL